MEKSPPEKPKLKFPDAIKRKAISVTQERLVKTQYLEVGQLLPLVVKPALDGVDIVGWAEGGREWLETQLLAHGAILLRDFQVRHAARLESLIKTVSGELLEYTYRSTPRHQVDGRIYTSTEYPASEAIPLHNEMAYSRQWPMKIWFCCLQAAQQGGETPIADSRKVFQQISPGIKRKFIEKQVMYVRNYGEGLDLSWQEVFQTNSKAEVEQYCSQAGITYEWKADDGLRTRQVCQAVARHPKTGDEVWFNQAHLFHVTSLPAAVREALFTNYREDDLPRNAFYGDGSAIEERALDEIREIYQQEAKVFKWNEGDVLLVDNMLSAHGRTPFTGSRHVIVGMS